ncbi:MAG: transglutaminase-like domain-containing protein [Microbacterium sp.]
MPRPPVAGACYVLAMVAVAAVAAWPIYRSADFVVVVVAAALLGTAIAVVSAARRWSGWLTALVTAGAIVVAGVLLAVPARRGDPAQLPAALVDVATGAVTGFKDLVTVDLPVGSYRNLLVPALVIFLVGTLGAMRLSWRSAGLAGLGAAVALAMVFFGLAFGHPTTSDPLVLGALTVPAPRELLTGALGLVLSLSWLAWLALDERRRALRRAADTTGVRVSRRRSASDTRRGLLAAGMVAIAVVIGAVAAPAIAAGQPRDVLRSATVPDVDLTRAEAPLSTYRSAFADPRYGETLFRVEAVSGALPARIRLATMTAYDGVVYRVLDGSSSVADARFVRVPSGLDAGAGEPAVVRVSIEGLGGIWLPTFGQVSSVVFSGADAVQLADGFYYNASSAAGVQTARGGLRSGDVYTVSAVTPQTPALADIAAPGASGALVAAPESLVTWIEQQDVGSGGAALAELIARLRARGYLSHALSIAADDPPAWVTDLGGYAFQPSASGHSLARVDALFRQLLARESQVEAEGGDGSLVAAVGDDEQFAVAAALIAQQLGFPARVVLGVRLTAADDGLRACRDGQCEAGDLTAWVEVQASTGEWVAVDVTPQHTEGIATDALRQRDPENPTDVRPESAREVVPPDPAQQDSDDDEPRDPSGLDLSGLWAGVRIGAVAALGLALVLGPFAVVVAAKAWRRRTRREGADAASRVVGGWEEYVDAAVDHGLPAPHTHTRTELAAEHARPAAAGLALAADRAVFSDAALTAEEAEEFWRIVDEERRGLGTDLPVWRRIAAAVSLKSFTRSLAARTGRNRAGTARRNERRMRRGVDAQSP